MSQSVMGLLKKYEEMSEEASSVLSTSKQTGTEKSFAKLPKAFQEANSLSTRPVNRHVKSGGETHLLNPH